MLDNVPDSLKIYTEVVMNHDIAQSGNFVPPHPGEGQFWTLKRGQFSTLIDSKDELSVSCKTS